MLLSPVTVCPVSSSSFFIRKRIIVFSLQDLLLPVIVTRLFLPIRRLASDIMDTDWFWFELVFISWVLRPVLYVCCTFPKT